MIWSVLSLQCDEEFPPRGVLTKKTHRLWTIRHRLEMPSKPVVALTRFSWQVPELRYCKTGVNNSILEDAFDLSGNIADVTKLNRQLLRSLIIILLSSIYDRYSRPHHFKTSVLTALIRYLSVGRYPIWFLSIFDSKSIAICSDVLL